MVHKKILFRVDAGGKVGLGHFYRSLNLALALQSRGHEIVFAHLPSSFWQVATHFPFRQYELSIENAEFEMLSILRNEKASVFYVDGIIPFTPSFIQEVKKTAKVVFYQNLSESKVLADVFILPSIHQDEAFFSAFNESDALIYKGLEYFTFNKEIEQYTPISLRNDLSIESVAVTAGGSDPRNVLLTLYEMLDERDILRNIKFTFFYGNDYLYKNEIPIKLKNNVSFLPYNTRSIISHDIIIAAFGVSAYEFMCLGKPVIGIGHQKTNADALKLVSERTEAIFDMGLIDDLCKENFNTTLKSLIQNVDKLVSMSQKATQVLDKQGVCRVADIIERL